MGVTEQIWKRIDPLKGEMLYEVGEEVALLLVMNGIE